MSSTKVTFCLAMVTAGVLLVISGCVFVPPPPSPSSSSGHPEIVTKPSPPRAFPPSPPAPEAEKPAAPEVQSEVAGPPPSPRAVASLQMTEQGRVLLEQKKVDDAIRVLERAVSINSSNGRNYYYLAEAWILKRNIKQAEEFNYLAGIYLEGDSTWMEKIDEQKKRIKNCPPAPQAR